ncbi:MAG: chromate resistance protein [Betaproteobacteria bacterium]|nr:chromate resistance protein [Betaproteobacteria bacterium]
MDTHTSLPRPLSVSALFSSLGHATSPLVIDVRRREAFESAPDLIASATWRDPFTVADWAKYLPRHRAIAVYCVHGHEISQHTADALRSAGFNAAYLEGGIELWKAAGHPLIHKMPECAVPSAVNAPSRWVTRERPKIDRIACPWLIRRFIDPFARFDYAPANDVLSYAKAHGAIAYDVPDVRFTHRGELCSFDALIEDFGIRDSALDALAAIVRGADTGQPDLTPQSAGLLAASLGLSVLYQDDHDMLEHGLTLYDALYAWAKSARGEVHNADLFKKS